MQNGTIQKTIHIAAPPEMVWDYLTKSEHLAKWFHRSDGDFETGKAFDMKGADGQSICGGAVTEMAPHSSLSYNFTAGPMNGLITRVTWDLTPVPGGTRLALVHTGFASDEAGFGLLAAFDNGWDCHLIRMREI